MAAITQRLDAWRGGDARAAVALFALIYDHLRVLARRQLAALRPGQTLAPTTLVHEAYLRFAERSAPEVVDRSHFLAVAARAIARELDISARTVKRDWRKARAFLYHALSPVP